MGREQSAHRMALRFARNAGVEPEPGAWPGLARALIFGPLSPVSFRLSGPDALSGAAWDVMTEAARCGAVTGPVVTEAERDRLAALVEMGRIDLAPLLTPAQARASERRAA